MAPHFTLWTRTRPAARLVILIISGGKKLFSAKEEFKIKGSDKATVRHTSPARNDRRSKTVRRRNRTSAGCVNGQPTRSLDGICKMITSHSVVFTRLRRRLTDRLVFYLSAQTLTTSVAGPWEGGDQRSSRVLTHWHEC